MATSSSPLTALLPNNNNTQNYKNVNGISQCSFLHRNNFCSFYSRRSSNKDLFVGRVTPPEVAGDLFSSSPLAGIPIVGDNPWLAGIAGLAVGIPLMIQRLLAISKQVEAGSQGVEKVADMVEDMFDWLDKAAEAMKGSLPEGLLKKLVTCVEKFAESASDGADMVSDLMDKLQELYDKLEELLGKDKKAGKS